MDELSSVEAHVAEKLRSLSTDEIFRALVTSGIDVGAPGLLQVGSPTAPHLAGVAPEERPFVELLLVEFRDRCARGAAVLEGLDD